MKSKLFARAIILSLIFLAINHPLSAQIIYTDVNPDTLLNTNLETYYIDLNQDGTNDFYLKFTVVYFHSGTGIGACNRTTYSCMVYSLNSNAIASDSIGASVFFNSASIGSSQNWNDTSVAHGYNKLEYSVYQRFCTSAHNMTTTYSGNWLNQNDKYLGLKLISNGSTYYGWARLHVNAASSITLKDFGYNSVANQSVSAGEGANFAATYVTGSACAGGNFNIPYIVQGVFNPGNIFTAELSSSTGSFVSPTTIGSITSISSDTIHSVMPTGAMSGAVYRVRIVSTNPVSISSDNGTNISLTSINAVITNTTANPGCGHVVLAANTGTGNTFQWMMNNAILANGLSSGYSATQNASYTCTITNACGSSTSNVINVTVYRDAAVSLESVTTTEVCPGNSLNLVAKARLGLTYQWYSGSVLIPNSNNPTYTAHSSGNYSVRVTNIHGCTATSGYVNIYIRNPAAPIYNNGLSSFCNGDSTELYTDYNSNYAYQWLRNGVVIPGANAEYCTVYSAGNYQVNVSNVNCDSTSGIITIHVNCRERNDYLTNNPKNNLQFSVYPNPLSQIATISFSLDQAEAIFLMIYDVTGQIVKTLVNERLEAGIHQFEWDAKNQQGKDLSSGIYFLKIFKSDQNNKGLAETKMLSVIN